MARTHTVETQAPGAVSRKETAAATFATAAADQTHVTVITRRRDRRIMGKTGARENICGAAPTLRDVLYRDAKRDASWITCPDCRRHMGQVSQ